MKQIFTFLLILLLAINGLAQNVGESAKDFTLKDLSDANYKLSSKEGKVILIFMVGYNCSFCISSARDVKSQLVDVYGSNNNFEAVVIDVWDGNKTAVEGFKTQTGLNAVFLQKGSSVASDWSATYDRLFVVDGKGKIAFRGTRNAKTDVPLVKSAVQTALNNLVVTAVNNFELAEGFELGQNYPNPVQNETKIHFQISEASDVNLSLYDVTGRMVSTIENNYYQAGEHTVTVRREGLKSGVYFYKMNAGEFTSTKRMVVQ